jgi:hypothetical protein
MRRFLKVRWGVLAFFLLFSSLASAQQSPMPGERSVAGEVASLLRQGQILRGGAKVRSVCATGALDVANTQCIAPSSITIDCSLGPLQFVENNGAFTFNAPLDDGNCFVMFYNGASAGTPTPGGFTVGSNTGSAFTTTSTNLFTVSIWRITIPGVGSTSGYTVFAHQ